MTAGRTTTSDLAKIWPGPSEWLDRSASVIDGRLKRVVGVLPVPVGYPATYPAVWLSDSAGIGPGDVGIIGFLDRNGIPVTLLRSSASDTQIRAAIKQLPLARPCR